MSELTNALTHSEATQHEPWNPGGSIITVLLASLALFFIGSVFTLIGACAFTSLIDGAR